MWLLACRMLLKRLPTGRSCHNKASAFTRIRITSQQRLYGFILYRKDVMPFDKAEDFGFQ